MQQCRLTEFLWRNTALAESVTGKLQSTLHRRHMHSPPSGGYDPSVTISFLYEVAHEYCLSTAAIPFLHIVIATYTTTSDTEISQRTSKMNAPSFKLCSALGFSAYWSVWVALIWVSRQRHTGIINENGSPWHVNCSVVRARAARLLPGGFPRSNYLRLFQYPELMRGLARGRCGTCRRAYMTCYFLNCKWEITSDPLPLPIYRLFYLFLCFLSTSA